MLRLVIILTVFLLVNSEELLGVNYSFDIDFHSNFNSKRCGNDDMWQLVRYGKLDMKPPYTDSDKAIQAFGKSCSTSFPIIFVGGILEISVYSQEISQIFNLRIEVFDDNDLCITSYVYRRSSTKYDFVPGWQIISMKINKHIKGYIQLQGRTHKNELLLIDSFRYTPNDTIAYNDKRLKRSLDFEKDEDEIIFNYKESYNQYDSDRLEGSGDEENGTEQPPPIDQPMNPEGRTFWNPFTIALVSFGVGVVAALFIVGAYHFGKVRAVDNDFLPYVDLEPPRRITIPRANGRPSRTNPLRSYNF